MNDLVYFDIVDGKKVVCETLKRGEFADVNWSDLLKELGLSVVYNKDLFTTSGPPHKKVSHNRIFQHDKDRELFVVIIDHKDFVMVAETRESEELVLSDPSAFIRTNKFSSTQKYMGKVISSYKVANEMVNSIREMYG